MFAASSSQGSVPPCLIALSSALPLRAANRTDDYETRLNAPMPLSLDIVMYSRWTPGAALYPSGKISRRVTPMRFVICSSLPRVMLC